MNKNLVMFFDGTENDSQSDTNVYKLYTMLSSHKDDREQLSFYRPGVGTAKGEWFWGSVFGKYTTRNLCDGYQWLRQHYELGDKIFIFGFSRGAFAALGLVGFIAWCGLLYRHAPISVKKLFERYKNATVLDNENNKKNHRNLEQIMAIGNINELTNEERLIQLYHQEGVEIEFIGIFDTVRAAGLEALTGDAGRFKPNSKLKDTLLSVLPEWVKKKAKGKKSINEKMLSNKGTLVLRHTRHVPPIVNRVYHALAIDEHRKAYAERLLIVPLKGKNTKKEPYIPEYAEQRWFAGAHSNVGGGYDLDVLSLIPLEWMKTKAEDANLGFSETVKKPQDAHLGLITNSYREFLKSFYQWLPRQYHNRQLKGKIIDAYNKPRNLISVDIDESVLNRIIDSQQKKKTSWGQIVTKYPPDNNTDMKDFLEWLNKNNLNSNNENLVKEALNVLKNKMEE